MLQILFEVFILEGLEHYNFIVIIIIIIVIIIIII